MHGRVRRPLMVAALGLAVAACAGRTEVTLQPVRFEEFQHRLTARRGSVVVVEVWATWCAPCLERFPHMLDLERRYRDRGLRLVTLSVDNRDDPLAVAEARRFLTRHHAASDNYLLDENVLQSFEKLDLLSIPAVLVFDRQGVRRHKLTGDDPNHQFTLQDVERAVLGLLSETRDRQSSDPQILKSPQ